LLVSTWRFVGGTRALARAPASHHPPGLADRPGLCAGPEASVPAGRGCERGPTPARQTAPFLVRRGSFSAAPALLVAPSPFSLASPPHPPTHTANLDTHPAPTSLYEHASPRKHGHAQHAPHHGALVDLPKLQKAQPSALKLRFGLGQESPSESSPRPRKRFQPRGSWAQGASPRCARATERLEQYSRSIAGCIP
jgi:hypothetical protein